MRINYKHFSIRTRLNTHEHHIATLMFREFVVHSWGPFDTELDAFTEGIKEARKLLLKSSEEMIGKRYVLKNKTVDAFQLFGGCWLAEGVIYSNEDFNALYANTKQEETR